MVYGSDLLKKTDEKLVCYLPDVPTRSNISKLRFVVKAKESVSSMWEDNRKPTGLPRPSHVEWTPPLVDVSNNQEADLKYSRGS